MQIRRLGPDDAAAHHAMRMRAMREQPEAFTTSIAELQAQSLDDVQKRMGSANVKLWGAFDAGMLVGQVGLDRETRVQSRHKATLVGMYVTPEQAGQGLGRALVETVLAEARQDGLALVVLTVTHGNERATALYERCGFRSFGIEPDAIRVDGRFFAKNHMYLQIAPPARPAP